MEIKKVNNFILDFETLGQNVNSCPAIDCAYFIFDWNRFTKDPYTFSELTSTIKHDKLNIQEQVEQFGSKIESSSLDWWSQRPSHVRKKILPSDSDISIKEFLENQISYLQSFKKINYWWSRSNTFDPIIQWRLMNSYPEYSAIIESKLKFWTVRDIRTFIDAKFNFSTKNGFCPFTNTEKWNNIFEEHNAIHDVAADILRIQTITRAEADLEIINE